MDEQTNQNQTQTPPAPQADKADVEKNKTMAIIGYIFPFLFFIPLVSDAKNSKFAKFHANQQLDFLLFGVAGWIVVSVLSAIFAMTIVLIPLIFLLWLALFVVEVVFMVMGAINASKGEMKPLPLIGGIQIVK